VMTCFQRAIDTNTVDAETMPGGIVFLVLKLTFLNLILHY